MSLHSYSRCWIHLVWGTLNREKVLNKAAAARLSRHLDQYAKEQGIYMKINHVNADHTHALVDLPTSLSIEKLIQLLKGSSSHWINSNNLIAGKFAWGRGMPPSPCRSQMWSKLPRTSRDKKNITVSVHSPRNSESSAIATVYIGKMKEAVETASEVA